MTASYVAIVQLQREAAQLTAMSQIVERKLAAAGNRENANAALLVEQAQHHVREARHHALNAASVLDALLAETPPAPVGECEICHEPILATEAPHLFAGGTCHAACVESAVEQANAALYAANDAYERGR